MSSAEHQLITDAVFDLSDLSTPHDAILVVQEHKFYVQKERLSESSDFFKNLFEKEVAEMNETIEIDKEEKKPKKKSFKLFRGCFKTPVKSALGVVVEDKEEPVEEFEIQDVSAVEFGEFLKFFYPGDFLVTVANYSSLASLSVRFGLQAGFSLCKEFLLCHFDEIDVVHMIEFAIKYNMEDIKTISSALITADKPVDSSFPWTEDYNGCSCNKCIKDALKLVYDFPFNKGSFCHKNKNSIQAASEKAKAFIIEEIVKAKF